MSETKSIIVERRVPHRVEEVWDALTRSALLAKWLMTNHFEPSLGHRFTFRAKPLPGWAGISHCEVLKVEAPNLLAYRWGDGTESESGLKTIVTWSIQAEGESTRVRMEHSGFRPEDERGFTGMGSGWPRILERLERVIAAAARPR